MKAVTSAEPLPYKAFISYSHAADGKLAPALESALERYAKPWHRARAFHVFRDESDLALNPHLWSSVEKALAQSRPTFDAGVEPAVPTSKRATMPRHSKLRSAPE